MKQRRFILFGIDGLIATIRSAFIDKQTFLIGHVIMGIVIQYHQKTEAINQSREAYQLNTSWSETIYNNSILS